MNAKYDYNNYKFVGWPYFSNFSECYESLFSDEVMSEISRIITQQLKGVNKDGRDIIVTNEVIGGVISQVYSSQNPEVGDIYTRYIIPRREPRNDVEEIVRRTIQIITSRIKTELGMEECNNNLSIWNTLYGDFNEAGLRAYPPIKLNNRRPPSMLFNMRY